ATCRAYSVAEAEPVRLRAALGAAPRTGERAAGDAVAGEATGRREARGYRALVPAQVACGGRARHPLGGGDVDVEVDLGVARSRRGGGREREGRGGAGGGNGDRGAHRATVHWPFMPREPASADDVATGLREVGYLPGASTALVSFLAAKLGKPVLVEGPA